MATTDLPSDMLAARVVEFNKPYALEHVPIPSPGPYDLLLRVGVASYCHTDSMVVQGTMGTTLPCTASHEGAGTVVRTGSSISQSDFKPGDRVMAGIPHNRCQKCESCTSEALKGYRQYCPNVEGFLGVTTDGAFADYMLADARDSVKVPDGVGFEIAAPMACAGSTVYRAVLQARVKGEGGGKGGTGKEKDQETLGIVGAGGGLGHLGVKFAKAMGIRVVALDARDEGLALAKESGADVVVDARGTKEDVVKQVQDVTTGSKGVDATINLSDHETAAALSCAITKAHGTMIQIAQPENVCIPFLELLFRDIRVKGSLICTQEEARQMLQLVADHNITVKTNLFYGLEELPKLVDLVHSGKMAGKAMIVIDEAERRRPRG